MQSNVSDTLLNMALIFKKKIIFW